LSGNSMKNDLRQEVRQAMKSIEDADKKKLAKFIGDFKRMEAELKKAQKKCGSIQNRYVDSVLQKALDDVEHITSMQILRIREYIDTLDRAKKLLKTMQEGCDAHIAKAYAFVVMACLNQRDIIKSKEIRVVGKGKPKFISINGMALGRVTKSVGPYTGIFEAIKQSGGVMKGNLVDEETLTVAVCNDHNKILDAAKKDSSLIPRIKEVFQYLKRKSKSVTDRYLKKRRNHILSQMLGLHLVACSNGAINATKQFEVLDIEMVYPLTTREHFINMASAIRDMLSRN